MKRAALSLFDGFIEPPFESRFQGRLRQAWKRRRWPVIVAEPGSGKTMGSRDLSGAASREVGMIGGRRDPVLAVTAPKKDPKEAALGTFLLTALGLGARGHWSERKYLLFELLIQYGVECLLIDDAHDLSLPHLIFLKELTDQLQILPTPHVLGFCFTTWQMPDAMADALYLLAGTIFPIAILPGWVEKIALLMPLTYWLELIRRALLGDAVGRTFPIASAPEVIGLLLLTTALAIVVCLAIFPVSDHVARERGHIDRPTGD